jgi:hypothetical protein
MKQLVRLAVAAALAVTGLTAGMPASQAGTNLAPNPSFEDAAVAPADPLFVATAQPWVPAGWVFEGAAGLFDYGDSRCLTASLGLPCRPANSGFRFVAISDPLSGPECKVNGQCYGSDLRQLGALAYSVTPVWRTAAAVPVSGGTDYTFSSAVRWDLATEGAGPFLQVRWVDGNGVPVSVDRVAFEPATAQTTSTGWHLIGGIAHAPANAAGAILMLGHSDDAWISSIRFDDVFFG